MIAKIVLDDLREVIKRFKIYDEKTYNKSEDYYINELKNEFAKDEVDDDAIRYAIQQFNKLELWKKSIAYFKAIVIRKNDELLEKKSFEKRSLGGVPKNVG